MSTRTEFCDNCRFAFQFGHSAYCHRYPPVPKRQPADCVRQWTPADWEFPLTRESDWCGEWAPYKEVAADAWSSRRYWPRAREAPPGDGGAERRRDAMDQPHASIPQEQPVSSPTLAERVRRVWALRQAVRAAVLNQEEVRQRLESAVAQEKLVDDAVAAKAGLEECAGDETPQPIRKVMYWPMECLTDADLAEAIRVAEERDAADGR